MPNKHRIFLTLATVLFISFEFVLFVLILWGKTDQTAELEFGAVVIAAVFASLCLTEAPHQILTAVALGCTVVADFCLEILQPMQQTYAMIFFLMVQICYAIRLFLLLKTNRWRVINLVLRVVFSLIAVIITISVLRDKFDVLSCLSILYYTNLILNVVLASAEFPRAPLLASGLWLFLCCDTFVGLQCAADVYLNIPAESILGRIIFAPFNFAWFFYIPAQVLIVTSMLKTKARSI